MYEPVTDQVLSFVDGVALHLDALLPWVKYLNATERAELLADLIQARIQVGRTGEMHALTEVLEEWEATALVLSNERLATRLQATQAPEEYTSWEDIRATLPGETAS
jgi:hypothetical protein